MNAVERFRYDITLQLLERAAAAWAAGCAGDAERLAAAGWVLVGDDDFIDTDESGTDECQRHREPKERPTS